MYVSQVALSNIYNNVSGKKLSKPSFGVNERWVFDEVGTPLYKTTTGILRGDLPWADYINRNCNKYATERFVKVVIHACSSGLEGLSFLLSLMHLRPNEVDKFTPIIAKDINKDNILKAQSGRFEVTKEDIARINKFTGGKCSEYFDCRIRGDKYYIIPKKELRDRIIFEQGDIFEDVKRMPPSLSILHSMNMWPYLPALDRIKLSGLISRQFVDESSTITLGDFDHNVDADVLLNNGGFFEELGLPNVFSRPSNMYKYTSILY